VQVWDEWKGGALLVENSSMGFCGATLVELWQVTVVISSRILSANDLRLIGLYLMIEESYLRALSPP
jgi:hypothetical protein